MPTVLGYGLEGALKFGCYEHFKGVFNDLTSHSFLNMLVASVVRAPPSPTPMCCVSCVVCNVVLRPSPHLPLPFSR